MAPAGGGAQQSANVIGGPIKPGTPQNSRASLNPLWPPQAAVPKFMQLRLAPATGTALSAGGPPIQQRISVTNSMHGQKNLVMRLRIAYTLAGAAPVVEQAEVKNFPPGL